VISEAKKDRKRQPHHLPNGWQWMKLGDVLTYRQEFFTIDDDTEYQLVTVKLHGRGIVPREKLRGSQIKTKQQQSIRSNQLLVAEIDAKLGGFGIVPRELEGSIVSGHYFLYDIDADKVLPEFVECFIASGVLTEEVQQYVQGSTNYAAIRAYHVLEIWMPVPPKDQQAKFAQQLKEVRKMQVAAEHQLEAATALEGALMRQVFGVFEPPEEEG
jgi:type I restriction enzyme S subunit